MRSHCKNHRIAHSRSGHCCRRKNSFDNSFSIFMPTVIAIHLLVFFVMLSLFLFMRTKWSDDDDDDTSNRLDNMQMHILISLWWNMENDSAHNLILMSASIFVILAALTIYRMLLCCYATVFPPFSLYTDDIFHNQIFRARRWRTGEQNQRDTTEKIFTAQCPRTRTKSTSKPPWPPFIHIVQKPNNKSFFPPPRTLSFSVHSQIHRSLTNKFSLGNHNFKLLSTVDSRTQTQTNTRRADIAKPNHNRTSRKIKKKKCHAHHGCFTRTWRWCWWTHKNTHTQRTHANFGNRYQIAVLMQEK